MSKLRDNIILSQITLITSIGDWLTYFALLKLATDVSGSVIIGTLSIAMKSAAVAAGAILIPMFVGVYSSRVIILCSEWISAALMAGMCASVALKITLPVPAIYSVMFLQTVLKQLFDAARESHSKGLAVTTDDHRPMQAQILSGLFGAQFFGPLLAFFLLSKGPLWLPFFVDALTFVVSGVLARKIGFSPLTQVGIQPLRFLRPLAYIKNNPLLRDVLIFRSIIWIPFGLFNILLFQVVLHRYEFTLDYATIPYSVIGLGAAAGSFFLRFSKSEARTRIGRLSEGTLACFSQISFGLSIVGFLFVPSFQVAMIFTLITGITMGLNMVSTMTIRRKLCTSDQLPEVMGLELLMGRLIEVCTMTAMAAALNRGLFSYRAGIGLSATLFVVSGLAHLRFRNAGESLQIGR